MMLQHMRACALTGLILSAAAAATPASAASLPLGDTISTPQATAIQPVQWRGHRGGYGRGRGWGGVGAGIVGGAIVGSLLAPRYYYNEDGSYYGGGRRYYYSGAGDESVSYCASRFRSYDPASGTYLGYDGLRHACP